MSNYNTPTFDGLNLEIITTASLVISELDLEVIEKHPNARWDANDLGLRIWSSYETGAEVLFDFQFDGEVIVSVLEKTHHEIYAEQIHIDEISGPRILAGEDVFKVFRDAIKLAKDEALIEKALHAFLEG